MHWASVNGHLSVVQLLVKQGADATIFNEAGHDAVYEAELAEKNDVVDYLLKEATGLETGLGAEDTEMGGDASGNDVEGDHEIAIEHATCASTEPMADVEGGLGKVTMKEG